MGGRLLGLAALAVISLAGASPSQNLIENGSFESGVPCEDGSLTLAAGSTGLSPWLVSGGEIRLVCNLWAASEGKRSIDLSGASGGALEQMFHTDPGRPYDVIFYLGGNPDGPPETKFLRVSAAGQWEDFSFSILGRTRSDMGWSIHAWRFFADSARTTLAFQSLTQETAYGPALDDVEVWPLEYLFQRGDANADSVVDISDPIYILSALFFNKEGLPCDDAADSNDDGIIDIADAVAVLVYLFEGGFVPPPTPICGFDPCPDVLSCSFYPPCS